MEISGSIHGVDLPSTYNQQPWSVPAGNESNKKCMDFSSNRVYKDPTISTDKATSAERRGQRATGPRYLREATEDSSKDSKTARPLIVITGDHHEKTNTS